MQFRTEPRKLPIVLSVEEVSTLLAVAPGPGLKLQISEILDSDFANSRTAVSVITGQAV